MMKKNYFLLAIVLLYAFNASAQSFLKKVILAEGGSFGSTGNQVKIASYLPAQKIYNYIDSIAGDFTNDVLVDGDYAFIHIGNADPSKEMLYKYNIKCLQRIDSVNIPGLQKMKVSGSKLIVSRGYGADSNYAAFYDKSNLNLIHEFSEVNKEAAGIALNGSKAYIAVTGSWPAYTDTGLIAVLDIPSNSFDRYIKLDTFAKEAIQVFSTGNNLYVFSSFSYLSVYDLSADTFTNYYRPYMDNAFGFVDNKLYFNNGAGNESFDIISNSFSTSGLYSGPYSFGAYDTLNNEFFYLYQNWAPVISNFVRTNSTGSVLLDSLGTGLATVMDLYYGANTLPLVSDRSIRMPVDHDTTIFMTAIDGDCDALFYSISAGPMRIGASASIDASGNVYYHNAPGLVADDTVHIRVCDISGQCSDAVLYIHVFDIVGIDDQGPLNTMISVFPNPASDIIHVSLRGEGITILTLKDMQGRTIQLERSSENSMQLDVSNLANGVYLLQIDRNGQTASKKLIKQ